MKVSKRFGVILIAGVIVIGGSELGERLSVPGVHSLIPTAAPGVRIEVASLWGDVCEDGASPIPGLHARWGSAGKEPVGRL